MSFSLRPALLSLSMAVGVASPSFAVDYEIGKLRIETPWLRAPGEGADSAPLFMVIHNNGDTPDKLVAVKSDKFGKAVLHTASKRIVTPHGIVIPPHATVLLEPGRPFVSMEDIRTMSPVGASYGLELVFEKAGELPVEAAVEAPDAKRAHDAEAAARWAKAHASQAEAAAAPAPAAPAAETK